MTVFKTEIRSFLCVEETDGLGSDEVAFFLTAVPVIADRRDTPESWRYGPQSLQSFRQRHADDVDSGEERTFDHPISIEMPLDVGVDYIEYTLIILEIDGPSSLASQAADEHRRHRRAIEETLTEGTRLATTNRQYGTRRGDYSHRVFIDYQLGDIDENLIAFDVWHVDLEQPLEGSAEWESYDWGRRRWTPRTPALNLQSLHDVELTVSKFDPRPTPLRIERRSYRNRKQDSEYRFDVRYTIED